MSGHSKRPDQSAARCFICGLILNPFSGHWKVVAGRNYCGGCSTLSDEVKRLESVTARPPNSAPEPVQMELEA